jgi:hypothetical protein
VSGPVLVFGPSNSSTQIASGVSRMWLTDVSEVSSVLNFVWAVEFVSGRLWCWVVPGDLTNAHLDCLSNPLAASDSTIGVVYMVGRTSTWMQQSASATKGEYHIGTVPHSHFGCPLSVGQEVRHLPRSTGIVTGRQSAHRDLGGQSVFGPSCLSLSPPVSTAASFVHATLVGCNQSHSPVSVSFGSPLLTHFRMKVSADSFIDSSMGSLEILILRAIEGVASRSTSGTELASDHHQRFRVYCALACSILTMPKFVALFVEIGRQIEPSFHRHLFPIPVTFRERNGDRKALLADDLFCHALMQGSLSLAVSTLPLFLDDNERRKRCVAAFTYCLEQVRKASECDCVARDSSDKYLIGDIFRFGLRLEGAGRKEVLETEALWDMNEDGHHNGTSRDSAVEETATSNYSLFCGVTRVFRRRERQIESRISKAASSFIEHEVDAHQDNGVSLPATMNGKKSAVSSAPPSIAIRTAFHIRDAIIHDSPEATPWKELAALEQMLASESLQHFQSCSPVVLSLLVRKARKAHFASCFQGVAVKEIMVRELARCAEELSCPDAARLLNLSLVLIEILRQSTEESPDARCALSALLFVVLILVSVANGEEADSIGNIVLSEGDSFLSSMYADATRLREV